MKKGDKQVQHKSKSEYLFRFFVFTGYSWWLFNLYISGTIIYYIHVRFFNLVLFTATIMLVFAIMQILGAFSKDSLHSLTDYQSSCCGAHSNQSVKPWPAVTKKVLSYLVFIAPLCFGLLFAPHALDPVMAERRGFDVNLPNLQDKATAEITLVIEDNRIVVDYENYTIFADELWGNPQKYLDIEVNAVGFLFKPPWLSLPDRQYILGRYLIHCCVADATVAGFLVEMPASYQAANLDWVIISGRIVITDFGDEKTGAIIVEQYEITDEPLDPYLYY